MSSIYLHQLVICYQPRWPNHPRSGWTLGPFPLLNSLQRLTDNTFFHCASAFCHLGRSFSRSNQNNAAHLLPKPLIRQAAVANGLILLDIELSKTSAAKGSLWREHSLSRLSHTATQLRWNWIHMVQYWDSSALVSMLLSQNILYLWSLKVFGSSPPRDE